jgi:hypothetical protein
METKQTQLETNLENLQYLLDQTKKGILETSTIRKTLYNSINSLCCVESLVSVKGFLNLYFEELTEHETKSKAFDDLNERYKNYFGEYKFKDFKEFREFYRLDLI